MPKILHLDLDAFFCAVEEHRDPALTGKPFAVGGSPNQRGVVASCSYPARQFGVRSAMPMSVALRRCPNLIIVPHHFDLYRTASRQVMARLRALTPLVEQLSIDEAFLDVTALPDPAETIARRLQAEINTNLHYPCSLGVATNKLVAKIANNIGKAANRTGAYPNAITVVPPGHEAEFLAPLPVSELWGVGPKTAERLAELGITTIGQLAAYPELDLIRRFGQHGEDLARHARAQDNRPVVTARETKSISQERTFAQDVTTADPLQATLTRLTTTVVASLKKERLLAATVKIKLRWSDFTTLTRQITLAAPTDDFDLIHTHAQTLLATHRPADRPVRLLGIGVSQLSPPPNQLTLWDWQQQDEKQQHLHTALDAIRTRFGDDAVQTARHLPTSPDPDLNTP